MPLTVSVVDVRAAQPLIASYLHRTPLLTSQTLSELTNTRLHLKAENLQKTGSFKPRGGINAVFRLPPEERARGVIAVSAGNHGAAVAYAARLAQITATVVMPHTASLSKIAAIQGYGATVRLVPGDRLMESMEEMRAAEGQVFLHPFDHPHVIAGQGTVGLEILDDLSDVEVVVVPVGGGGLLSGVATAVKACSPGTRVIGVEPEGSRVVSQSLAAGRPLRLAHYATVADGLNAPWAGELSLGIIKELVDDVVTVSDAHILDAERLILQRTKLLVEPAGAAGIAALLHGLISNSAGRTTVCILSGGNVDLQVLLATP